MNNIFLNPDLKVKYMEDFVNKVLLCNDEFWDLDENLREVLSQINSNPNLQTLYSRKATPPKERGMMFSQTDSYLKLTFVKEFELKILRDVIPECISIFTDKSHESFCTYQYYYPDDNANYREDKIGRLDLGCLNDKDHFRVNHVRIELDTSNLADHDKFWQFLNQRLSNLK